MSALVLAGLVAMVPLVYLMIRNFRVHDFRVRLLRQVGTATRADIDAGRIGFVGWSWRFDCYAAVSYERMLFSLKPLRAESYYTDTDFLRVAS